MNSMAGPCAIDHRVMLPVGAIPSTWRGTVMTGVRGAPVDTDPALRRGSLANRDCVTADTPPGSIACDVSGKSTVPRTTLLISPLSWPEISGGVRHCLSAPVTHFVTHLVTRSHAW